MDKSDKIRRVNRTIGLPVTILGVSIYQLLPIGGMAMFLLYLRENLQLSWWFFVFGLSLWSGLVSALLGNKPWLFFNRLKPVPWIVRGGAEYIPLLPQVPRAIKFRSRR